VRISVFSIVVLLVSAALLALPLRTAHFQEAPPQQVPPQAPQALQPQQVMPPPLGAPAPVPSGPVIVIDPAHGATDTGARDEGALAEKDIVLQLARTVRERLERQAYRVLMTRNDDSNPSYDDRAAVANAHRDVIFISLHVASTGRPGTVRAYYDQLSSSIPRQSAASSPHIKSLAPPRTNTLVAWDQAQRPYLDASHHLADLIQIQLVQSFSGSPLASTPAPVRALRSIMGPAIAIEISSISGSTQDELTGSGGPLSTAIARGISALRPSAEEVR
jgi:N-acetylmuramoyl-L-alanine amidase